MNITVELTLGKFQDKQGQLITVFPEKHLGEIRQMAQVRVKHNNEWHIVNVRLETVRVI